MRVPDLSRHYSAEMTARLFGASSFHEAVMSELRQDSTRMGVALPWGKLAARWRLRPAEATIWAGQNASYKSWVVGQAMLYRASQGDRVVIASLEMTAPKVLARMTMQGLVGTNPPHSVVGDFLEYLNETLTIFDLTGSMAPRDMLALARYCARELCTQHFFIDNLTKVVGIDAEHADEQRTFMADLHRICLETGMHAHVVAHVRKPPGDTDRPPSRYEIRGSGTISDQADNVATIWRNRPKEEAIEKGEASQGVRDEPDCIVLLDKQRHGAWEGTLPLWIDRRCMRFEDSPIVDPEPFWRV